MNMPGFSLAGKVALVTGCRRGIGRSIAIALAEAGADVAACDVVIDDGKLENVAQGIRDLGRRSLVLQADTSSRSDVEEMVEKVSRDLGFIDILVNNAGVNLAKPILDLSEDEWDKIIDIDLKGYFLCAQSVGKRMVEKRKGAIINIASQFAFKAVPNVGAYCIAKAGVVMLTRVLARELGQYKIRSNAIAPGMVKTDFNRHVWTNKEFIENHLPTIPLGRLAEPGDLTGTALFLASDASRHVSGHTIVVDGGGIA
jgi:2-deoxy-D-gluconate 3-dehydrogenase